jgi:hypothetical protein
MKSECSQVYKAYKYTHNQKVFFLRTNFFSRSVGTACNAERIAYYRRAISDYT